MVGTPLPLLGRGRVLGALTLVHAESGRRFGQKDLPLVTELARRAGVKRLVLFHHDPRRDDAAVADLESRARGSFADVVAAREGMTLSARDAENADAS